MTRTKRHLAAAVAGLASLTWIGVSAAQGEDPVLDDTVEECTGSDGAIVTDGEADDALEESTDDESTDDESTDDESTNDESTNDESTNDESTDACVEDEDEDTSTVEATEEDTEDAEAGDHPLNHGFYVSEATKTCPESGRERGECISEVAKSDIGKPHADEESEEAEESAEDSESGDDGGELTDDLEGAPHEREAGHGKGHTKD